MQKCIQLLPLIFAALRLVQATPLLQKNDVESGNNDSSVAIHIYAEVRTAARSIVSANWGDHTDLVVQSGMDFDETEEVYGNYVDPASGQDYEMVGNLRFDSSSTENREFHVFLSTQASEVRGGADVSTLKAKHYPAQTFWIGKLTNQCTATFTGSMPKDGISYIAVLISGAKAEPFLVREDDSPDGFTVKCNWDGTGSPKNILGIQ